MYICIVKLQTLVTVKENTSTEVIGIENRESPPPPPFFCGRAGGDRYNIGIKMATETCRFSPPMFNLLPVLMEVLQ